MKAAVGRRVPVGALLLAASAASVRADVVTDWNATVLRAIKEDNTPPPRAAHHLAMVHVAMHDAVNGVSRRYESHVVKPGAPAGASTVAAAATAAHDVLASIYPLQSTLADAQLEASLATVPNGTSKADGRAWGRTVAATLLEERSDDGNENEAPYVASHDVTPLPGRWQPTLPGFMRAPLLPGWGEARTFSIGDPAGFMPAGPPPLDSPEWARDFDLTRRLGAIESPERSAEQTLIALFWADGQYTVTPPGHWNQIAQSLATSRKMPLEDCARMFALINVAMADAGICAWRSKYDTDFWRPVTAIRAADTDGNAATAPERAWTPLIVTPPFPECVSGHSTFSAAAATVLADVLGGDATEIMTTSEALPGVRRRFKSLSAAAEEAGMSRIYGGIHFMTANVQGQGLGRAVARHVLARAMRPLPEAQGSAPPSN